MKFHLLSVLAVCVVLSACTSMLPHGATAEGTAFNSFDDAHAAAERIVPFKTRVSELKALGFDPVQGTNVTVIPYPDIVSRLAPYSGVPMAELDPGIRECILAKAACKAWLFKFGRQEHERQGGFWADFFNVRRITRTTGWSVEALVVASDDKVLFRNVAGESRIDRVERQVNPLGPLQPAGESAGALLR